MTPDKLAEERKEIQKYLRKNIKDTKSLADEFKKALSDMDIYEAIDAFESITSKMMAIVSQYKQSETLCRIEERMLKEECSQHQENGGIK